MVRRRGIGLCAKASLTSLPRPQSKFTVPFGNATSLINSATRIEAIGVLSDILNTEAQPLANAGPSL